MGGLFYGRGVGIVIGVFESYSFVIGLVLFCCRRIQHSAYADGGLLMPTALGGGWVGSNQAQISKLRTTDNP